MVDAPARQDSLPACMGGWCNHRGHCARHVTDHRTVVVERLCAHGAEVPQPVLQVADVRRDAT
jgi:hypothetical protein